MPRSRASALAPIDAPASRSAAQPLACVVPHPVWSKNWSEVQFPVNFPVIRKFGIGDESDPDCLADGGGEWVLFPHRQDSGPSIAIPFPLVPVRGCATGAPASVRVNINTPRNGARPSPGTPWIEPAAARPTRFETARIDPLRAVPLRVGNKGGRGLGCSRIGKECSRPRCAESEHAGNRNSEGKPFHAVSLSLASRTAERCRRPPLPRGAFIFDARLSVHRAAQERCARVATRARLSAPGQRRIFRKRP